MKRERRQYKQIRGMVDKLLAKSRDAGKRAVEIKEAYLREWKHACYVLMMVEKVLER